VRPRLETERTDFGVRNYAIRSAGEGKRYVRVNNFVMPNQVVAVGNEGRVGEGFTVHWHVPIDDECHMRFDLIFNRVRPVARERYEQDRATEMIGNNFHRNKRNRYLQDRRQMKTVNFSGMGDYYAVHDAFAVETPGTIHDRTREHLGSTDACIVAARHELLAAIDSVTARRDPIHVIRDPAQNDMSHIVVISAVIGADVNHREMWKRKQHDTAAAD
jgi:hypothetical protein